MGNIITFITAHWEDIFTVYGAVVAACTTIVKVTPSKKDDTVWGQYRKDFGLFLYRIY